MPVKIPLLTGAFGVFDLADELIDHLSILFNATLSDAPYLATDECHVIRIVESLEGKVVIVIGSTFHNTEQSYLKLTVDRKTKRIIFEETSYLLIGRDPDEGEELFAPQDGPLYLGLAIILNLLFTRKSHKKLADQYSIQETTHQISRHGLELIELLKKSDKASQDILELVVAAFKTDYAHEVFWNTKLDFSAAIELLRDCNSSSSYDGNKPYHPITYQWIDAKDRLVAAGIYYPNNPSRTRVKVLRDNYFIYKEALLLIILSGEYTGI